jgi:pyruvate,water dikinase
MEMGNVAKTLGEVVKNFVDRYQSQKAIDVQVMSQAKKMVEKSKNDSGLQKLINIAKNKKKENISVSEMSRDDFLVAGIGASFGVARGKVVIVDGSVDRKVDKENILLIKKFSSEMESMIMSSAGVIMDTGGVTSDTAILCRECSIPAVLGAANASTLLKDGDSVYIDGNSGSVYRDSKMSEQFVENKEVHPVVQAYGDEDLSGIDLLNVEENKKIETMEEEKVETVVEEVQIPRDLTLSPTATKVYSMIDGQVDDLRQFVGNSHGIVYVDLDKIMIEDGRHIMAYVEDKKFVDYSKKICEQIIKYVELAQGDEVVVSIGSSTVDEFRSLKRGKDFEEESLSGYSYGATHYVSNVEMLKRVIKIIKRVRNVYKKRNVSVAIHSPMGVDMMKEFKKQLSGEKLRRTSSFMVYAILDNPAEVIMADEILSTNIDGLILNMPRIARQMQGFSVNDSNAKYDLSRNSVFKIVDNVVESVRPLDKKVVIVAEDSKPLISYSVKSGVHGVSVSSESIVDARKLVATEESKLILGK